MGKQKDMRMRRRGAIVSVTPSRKAMKRGVMPYTLYDTALTESAYGKPRQLGDLFGDIMGAVVGKENWDARPDWMKKIQVKPDPSKLLSTAAKVVPPSMVGKVVGQANQAGFDMYYNTPAGKIPVTPEFAEGVYSNYPTFLKARDTLASIPVWTYFVVGGGILFVLMMRK